MKKSIFVIACAAALTMALAGCGGSSSSNEPANTSSTSAPAQATPTPANDTSAPQSTPADGEGTLQLSLGELSMLSVHDSDDGVVADAVVEVINTGDTPLMLGTGTIRIGDANGNVILEQSDNGIFTGPTYLRPNDVGFIYTSLPLAMPEGYPAGDDYLVQGTADMTACSQIHQFPLSNQNITEDSLGKPTVTGTVTNDEADTAELIEITAIFLDNDDHMLGVSSTLVLDLAPGASADFEIDGTLLPVGCTMAVISGYDMIAVAPVISVE